MKIGTKSILFGVHQFLWHPLTVLLAWRKLYKKWPKWSICIAIFCHDLGYWGCSDIDGPAGKKHPQAGAMLAGIIAGFFDRLRGRGTCYIDGDTGEHCWLNLDIFYLAALHSRDYARSYQREPSKLYAADKASILFDPKYFYLLRARLSGEIKEFKTRAIASGQIVPTATDGEWFDFYRDAIRNRKGVKELL